MLQDCACNFGLHKKTDVEHAERIKPNSPIEFELCPTKESVFVGSIRGSVSSRDHTTGSDS
jgi:hypothetical protein